VRMAAPNQLVNQQFPANQAYFVPGYRAPGFMHAGPAAVISPRWNPNRPAQAGYPIGHGDMRSVGPRPQAGGGSGPTIRPMAAPVGARGNMHPTQMMHAQQVMQQQQHQFQYTQKVRNPAIPNYQQGQAPAQPAQAVEAPNQALHVGGQEPLTATMLAAAQPQEQKQMLGERLYPLIDAMHPDLASKITGMLLEIDNSELLHMLDSRDSLNSKVEEAVAVLQAHQQKVRQQTRQPPAAAPTSAEVPAVAQE